MSQGYPLTTLFSSVEEKPSSVHGTGIFATSSVAPGEYSVLPTDPNVAAMAETFGSVNSAMMPVWKDILLLAVSRADDNGSDDDGDDDDDDDDEFTARLNKFRTGFSAFLDDEQSKANIVHSVASSDGADFVVTVLRDLAPGEELLRSYGKEWLALKYYNLKSCLLHYRESVRRGDHDGDLVLSVDVTTLHATMWEFKGRDSEDDTEIDTAALGRYLSRREKKDLRVVSPEELNAMANVIGMVAMESLGTAGDAGFDRAWKHNIHKLARHFPRQVVHPASFATKACKKSKPKKERKKRKHGEVEKRKHGAFDVYKMK